MKKENNKPAKEIRLWTIICWISLVLAGATAIFSGVATIQAGQFFIGILFFVLAVFTFIPKKYLRISRSLKVVIFIVFYFTFLMISGFNTPTPEQQYEYYSFGEEFNLTLENNLFSMVIYNISTETEIVMDGENLSSQGVYIIISGVVKNLEKTPLDFSNQPELKDSDENLYTLVGFNIAPRKLQPNLERKFLDIFETPKDVVGLKYVLKDDTNIIKIISLKKETK